MRARLNPRLSTKRQRAQRVSATDRPRTTHRRQMTDGLSANGQTVGHRQTLSREQTSGRRTDLRSTNRPSVDKQPFGQRTDLRSTDRPSVDEQTFGRRTDGRQTDRANNQGLPGGGDSRGGQTVDRQTMPTTEDSRVAELARRTDGQRTDRANYRGLPGGRARAADRRSTDRPEKPPDIHRIKKMMAARWQRWAVPNPLKSATMSRARKAAFRERAEGPTRRLGRRRRERRPRARRGRRRRRLDSSPSRARSPSLEALAA